VRRPDIQSPFDSAAADAERALRDARMILLSTKRALDESESRLVAGGASVLPLDESESRLQGSAGASSKLAAAESALRSLRASLAAVRGKNIDADIAVNGTPAGGAVQDVALAVQRARVATASRVQSLLTEARSRAETLAQSELVLKLRKVAHDDPTTALAGGLMAGGLLLAALTGTAMLLSGGRKERPVSASTAKAAATAVKTTQKAPAVKPAAAPVLNTEAAKPAAAPKPAPTSPVPQAKVVKSSASVTPVAVKASPSAAVKEVKKAPATAPVVPVAAPPVVTAAPVASPAKAPVKAPKSVTPVPPKTSAAPSPKPAPAPAPAPAKPATSPPTSTGSSPAVARKVASRPRVPLLPDVPGPGLSRQLSYAIQKAFASPTSRAALFTSFAVATVLAGGALYSAVSGVSLPHAAIKAYSILNNTPGSEVNDGPNAASKVTANVLFVLGSLTFAVLIGLVGDFISASAAAVTSTNGPLAEAGHTLILGWNASAGALMRQLVAASQRNGAGRGPAIVILSQLPQDQVMADVSAALAGHVEDRHRPRVIVRQGSTISGADLGAVCAGAASHVIVLQPDNAEVGSPTAAAEDATKALAVMGLSTVRGVQPPRITVENMGSPSEDYLGAALAARTRAGGAGAQLAKRTTAVDARSSLARTLAACVTHPGLTAVYSDGLAAGGDVGGLHCVPLPRSLVGKSFGSVWPLYSSPVAGYIRSAAQYSVRLAPPDSDVLQKGDLLVVYARSTGDASSRTWFPPSMATSSGKPTVSDGVHTFAPAASNVLIAGLERTGMAEDLLRSLSEQGGMGAGSTVTVLSSSLSRSDVSKWTNAKCRFTVVTGDAAKRADLVRAGAATADHVLLLAPPGANSGATHVTTLAALLTLQDIAATRLQRGDTGLSPMHVVLTVGGHEAADVAQRLAQCAGRDALQLDIIDLHRLGAAAIAADVASSSVSLAADALLNARGGSALALRPASSYMPSGKGVSGWRLAKAVRSAGDVLMGWRLAGSDTVAVADDRGVARSLGPEDFLLVVTSPSPQQA